MRGTNSRILYDFFDASVSTAEWELALNVSELEVPKISSDVLEYVPGTTDLSLTINGYVEGIEGGFEEVLNTALEDGTRHVALILDHTNIPAFSYVIVNAFTSSNTWSAPFDGLLTINGSVRGALGGIRGNCVYYNITSGLEAEPSVQITTLTNGDDGRAFLFLHGWTGTRNGNIVIEVQSSPNNSTWTTVATFTMTSARSQMIEVTDFTGGFIRTNIKNLGGTTAINYSLIISE